MTIVTAAPPRRRKASAADMHTEVVTSGNGNGQHVASTPSLEPVESGLDMFLNWLATAAENPQVDAAKMGELWVIAREAMAERRIERKEEQRRTFFAKMAVAQSEFPIIGRTATGAHAKYATLEAIWEVCRPIWTKHGFSVSFPSRVTPEGLIEVVCRIHHEDGHYEDTTGPAAPPDTTSGGKANKTVVQGNQSTWSYLKRGLLCAAFGIVTAKEDDDGESAHRGGGLALHPRPTNVERSAPPPPNTRKVDEYLTDLRNRLDIIKIEGHEAVDRLKAQEDGRRTLYGRQLAEYQDMFAQAHRVIDAREKAEASPKKYTLYNPFGEAINDYAGALSSLAYARAFAELFADDCQGDQELLHNLLHHNGDAIADIIEHDFPGAKELRQITEDVGVPPPETAPAADEDALWVERTLRHIEALPLTLDGRRTFDSWHRLKDVRDRMAALRDSGDAIKFDLYEQVKEAAEAKHKALPELPQ